MHIHEHTNTQMMLLIYANTRTHKHPPPTHTHITPPTPTIYKHAQMQTQLYLQDSWLRVKVKIEEHEIVSERGKGWLQDRAYWQTMTSRGWAVNPFPFISSVVLTTVLWPVYTPVSLMWHCKHSVGWHPPWVHRHTMCDWALFWTPRWTTHRNILNSFFSHFTLKYNLLQGTRQSFLSKLIIVIYWCTSGGLHVLCIYTRGCTSGGVHVSCIYTHARWQVTVTLVTWVFVVLELHILITN